jgi:molecular chaperone IbpA|tara:strand:- start:2105 stop:2572 length:468 start_codon:yes stop_codon:yes gene_type:complete
MTGTFTFPRGAFVGFDHIAKDLERLAHAHQKDHYPPHNVVKHNDDEFLIELAVVGFKEKDIDITMHDGILTVKGDRESRRDQNLYVHKGISGRKFERSFRLSEFVEVTGADLEDGLLTIHLERIIPEEKRPRKILIGNYEEKNGNSNSQLLTESD